jgi:hypothetical protein
MACAVVPLFSACTMSTSPELPPAPAAQVVFLPNPDTSVQVVQVPSLNDPASCVTPMPAKPTKRGQAKSATQIVLEAQKAARIQPSERGYLGLSGEQSFIWTPGRIYVIYVSPRHPTLLSLPPGERLLSGFFLSSDEWDIHTERAGADLLAYDAIAIRPKGAEPKDVESFLLTESGKRFLVHLVNGPVGMLAVTFEAPQITQSVSREPTLTLPRPQP